MTEHKKYFTEEEIEIAIKSYSDSFNKMMQCLGLESGLKESIKPTIVFLKEREVKKNLTQILFSSLIDLEYIRDPINDKKIITRPNGEPIYGVKSSKSIRDVDNGSLWYFLQNSETMEQKNLLLVCAEILRRQIENTRDKFGDACFYDKKDEILL